MRITVTAFEPFGGFNTNSSFTAISQLDDSIDKLILPVSYPDAYIYLKEHLKESDLIILLGMAASRKTISLERKQHECKNGSGCWYYYFYDHGLHFSS